MENIDMKKAAAVWQRVQAQPPAPPDAGALLTMIGREQEAAVTYFHLSRYYTGKDAQALRQIAYREQAHASCLRGLYTMQAGKKPSFRTPPAPRGNRYALLRQCYNGALQSFTRYKALENDPGSGHIFARLAAQEQENSNILLEILGKSDPPR